MKKSLPLWQTEQAGIVPQTP